MSDCIVNLVVFILFVTEPPNKTHTFVTKLENIKEAYSVFKALVKFQTYLLSSFLVIYPFPFSFNTISSSQCSFFLPYLLGGPGFVNYQCSSRLFP